MLLPGATQSGFGHDRPLKTSQSVNGPSKVSHVQPHSSQFKERTNSHKKSTIQQLRSKSISSSRGTFPSNSLATMVSLSPVIGCSPPQPLILPPLRVCSLVANKKSTSTRPALPSSFRSTCSCSIKIHTDRIMASPQASTNYKEAFSLFDKRGTGRVQLESLGDLLRACGQNPTLAEIRDLEKSAGGDCT